MQIDTELAAKAAVKQSQKAAVKAAAIPALGEKQDGLTSDGEAAGYALAQSAIMQAKKPAWLDYVARLIPASVATRAAFVKYIGQENRACGEHVKAAKGTGDEELFKKARASAFTRLSELVQIARALNNGLVIEVKRDPDTQHPLISGGGLMIPVDPLYTIVARARMFNNSSAAGRGRPAKPFLDKLKAFMLKETEGKPMEEAKKLYADAAEATAMMVKLANTKGEAAPF